MARIVVTSACYLGDLAPFVAPANLLVERGHDVTFLAPAGFHAVLSGERFGLATYGLDFSAPAMHRDPEHQRLMRHPFRNQVALTRYWMRKGLVDDPDAARASLLTALDGADAVVCHPTFGQCVVPVAASLGVPSIVGHLFPMMIPTATRSMSYGWAGRDLGPTLNRASWRVAGAVAGRAMYDGAMNDHRAALGIEPMRSNALLGWTAADRCVTLLSPHYAGDAPDDWDGCELVGFSHWPGPAGQSVPEEVTAFLDAGDPPVLVCLGTSAASSASTFRTIVDGLEARGLRSLVLAGNDANVEALGNRPGVVAFAPISQVLPRCRAAVVSGSLGTLAACLAAAVPTVVVPLLFDQVWHGQRVKQLGVGRMVLRPSKVPDAVVRLDDETSARSAAVADAMRDEDGARSLADAVEATIS